MTELEKLIADCQKAAAYYEDAPGHAGSAAIIDLYRTVARLAAAIKNSK